MIIARFLSFFPNSAFLIMKSSSKSTAGKQSKIWWLVARWGGWGFPLVQVVLDGFCWLRIISDGFRRFAVLVVTPVAKHTEALSLYYTHGRT